MNALAEKSSPVFTDESFVGVPFRKYGRTFQAADCVGIVWLYLRHALKSDIELPDRNLDTKPDQAELESLINKPTWNERGDVIFFRHKKTGKITHLAVALGNGRLLHSTGNASRIDDGPKLIERLGYKPVGAIASNDAARLQRAIQCAEIGDPVTWTVVMLLVISIALSAASYAMSPKPKLNGRRNQKGAYSYDSQFTAVSSELPLPDILGRVHIAGNAIYTTLQDKTEDIVTPASVRMNRMIVYSSGPAEGIDWEGFNIRVNGLHYDNRWWYKQTVQSIERHGWAINPAQTKDEAVNGTFDTGLTVGIPPLPDVYTNQPSLSLYTGAHDKDVPVDIRASYDRNMPVYGLSGCCYIVARFMRVFFRTGDSYNTETEVSRDDASDQRARSPRIGNDGVVEESLHVPSIDSVAQAERFAEMTLRINLRVNRGCQFTSTLKGLALEPGDVVTVTHSADPAWNGKLATIQDIDHDAEDRLVFVCTEYSPEVFV